MSDRREFRFEDSPPEFAARGSGLDDWRAHRRVEMERFAARQGLPLGHRVRVDFENGPPLEGLLFLDEETLFLPERPEGHLALRIGTATFHANQISSCIRLD